jgi:hypothetical protein
MPPSLFVLPFLFYHSSFWKGAPGTMKTFFTAFLLLGSTAAHLRSHRKLIRAQDRSVKIDNQYILVFDDSVQDVDSKLASLMDGMPGCSVLYTYKDDFKGASVERLPDILLWSILEDPQILFAEEVCKSSPAKFTT